MKILVNIDGYAAIYNPAGLNQDVIEAAKASGFQYRIVKESELPEEKPMKQKWLWSDKGAIKLSPFTTEDVRLQRDNILASVVDPLVSNPLRWADLTTEQQQAWTDYRRALLDVPQQSGFPSDVIWPTQPK